MGNIFQKLFHRLVTGGCNPGVRILTLGLDGAGKTSILYHFRLGEVIQTIPTIGFNVESISYNNLEFTIWDVGGQERIRTLWRHYYQNTQALIYVVDSNDRDRIELAKQELKYLCNEYELKNCNILIYANKQDLPNAMSVQEVAEALELYTIKTHYWHIQGTSVAVEAKGLYEGLDWLSAAHKARRNTN